MLNFVDWARTADEGAFQNEYAPSGVIITSSQIEWRYRVTSSRKLSSYRLKRDFTKTAEPSGDAAIEPSSRRRFVIQKHAATRLHYDLRLELDGVFKSWAVT